VLRHLGVFAKRKRLLFLGFLEDVDLFSDMMFPVVALECRGKHMSEEWSQAWDKIPFVGLAMGKVTRHVGFCGCSIALTGVIVLWGIWSTVLLTLGCSQDDMNQQVWRSEQESRSSELQQAAANQGGTIVPQQGIRIRGEAFFKLANMAEIGSMYSLEALLEEMGDQRKWQFDSSKANPSGTTKQAMLARENYVLGKTDWNSVEMAQVISDEAAKGVEGARMSHFLFIMLVRVLIGNAAQLWLQASFFELAFHLWHEEVPGKSDQVEGLTTISMIMADLRQVTPQGKILFGMAMSALQVLLRSIQVSTKLGLISILVAMPNMLLLVWSVAKILNAYQCRDHVWNLSTGCVELNRTAIADPELVASELQPF